MKKRLFPSVALVLWSALLIRFIVFKAIPTIQIGRMRYRFGGRTQTGPANLVPFKTILPQLRGHGHGLIAKVNLLGNILPFIPVGFLVPLIYRKMTWPKTVALAVGTGLLMEVLEVIFRVGIFDVDDILLNALGVCIGFGCFRIFRK
ncbi:VanZ family protein [Terriglobus sp. RCC_193]|uniref:VanZ family protein n=1 Tax=Terriglobus sp. RCC_193 TaxID=3239218 RepID=UPI0035258E67